ncbi:MAG: alpha/beta hydrolase [Clostridia bacterium]|nr:alpha/beta hydrolase [Clostridia bacterium]
MQTILFLHGWGGNADSFAPISQYFAHAIDEIGLPYRVLTLSLPCPPSEVYTLDDYADDVDKFLYDQKVTRCIVIAHSFGARLVALLNARHPKLFTKIVITGGAGVKPRFKLSVWLKIHWYKFRRCFGFKIQGGSADYRNLDNNGKRTFQNIIQRDLTFEIQQIKVPVLLIWGKKDRDTPLEQLRRWRRLLPHAKHLIYPQCGHFAYLENSTRFILDVVRFLRGGYNA